MYEIIQYPSFNHDTMLENYAEVKKRKKDLYKLIWKDG